MPISTIELAQETDLIGTLTSVLGPTDASFTAIFVDKKTGDPRAPKATTLEYTLDQDNSLSETILASSNSTNLITGVTTIIIAANGRIIPKFGIGPGVNTGFSHQIGAAVGCVDIARPLNIIQQALTDKINTAGGQFTGLVNFLEPTGLLNLPTLTIVERNAIVSPSEGLIIENTTTGTIQVYLGGIWQDLGISTPTPNATTLVAGKVQIATQAQFNSGNVLGSTGASLDATPDLIQAGIQSGSQISGTLGGIANTYTIALTPTLLAYTLGVALRVKVNIANTGASTVNVNALGAITLKKNINVDLEIGDLQVGQIISIVYDGANFQIVGGLTNTTYSKNTVNADETVFGWQTNQILFSGGAIDLANGTYVANSGTTTLLKQPIGYNVGASGFTTLEFSNTKIVKLKTTVSFRKSGGTNNLICFGFATDGTGIAGTQSAINTTIRFVSDGANIYSVTADGGSNTNNTLAGTSVGFNNPQIWEIVWNPVATTVAFYINGILKATHATSIPVNNNLAQVGIYANSTGGSTELYATHPTLSLQI